MEEKDAVVLAGTKCSQHCSCGTAKADCKNKPSAATGEASNTNAGRNAFERHEIAVTEAKQEITVSPINIQKNMCVAINRLKYCIQK